MSVSLVFSSAGTKIYISAGVPATLNQAGYEALTYTEIKEVATIGPSGEVMGEIKFNPLGDPTTIKRKSNSDSGSISLKGGYAPTDAGQALLLAASLVRAEYAIKLVYANGNVQYGQGLVLGYQVDPQTSGAITMFDSNIALSGYLIRV